MNLFVIRHAIAEDPVAGQAAADRELTPDGDRKLRRIVKGLRKLDIHFERVLTSPWARAKTTAERLEPISDREPTVTELLCQTPLGELVAWLAFGDMRHGEALDLRKAGVVWLEGSAVPGGMTLRAMLTPKVLRAIR